MAAPDHTLKNKNTDRRAPLDKGSDRRRPDNTKLSLDTDIHAVSWISTHHPGKRAEADSRLRASGNEEHKMLCES